MENKIGLNATKSDNLVLDIYDINERVSKTLDQISMTIEKVKKIYNSTEASQFISYYESFKDNYSTIIKNINSYADDFIKLKQEYKSKDEKISQEVKLQMINIKDTFGASEYNDNK